MSESQLIRTMTISPALKKRLTGTKIVLVASEGLPEYTDTVLTQRHAAMQEERGRRVRRAFRSKAAIEQYAAERLAYGKRK